MQTKEIEMMCEGIATEFLKVLFFMAFVMLVYQITITSLYKNKPIPPYFNFSHWVQKFKKFWIGYDMEDKETKSFFEDIDRKREKV